MNRRGRVILNFAALQAGWFACVMGAAAELRFAGLVFVAAHLFAHFVFSPDRVRDVLVFVSAGVLGMIADSTLMRFGSIAFESGVIGDIVVPLWMIALWINFATSLNLTLEFLHGRYILAILFGSVGGAAAYIGGVRLGALSMPSGMWQGGAAVAVEWAVVMPLLVWVASRLDRWSVRRKNGGIASDTVTV